jgi:hypothetical protein
VQTLRQSPPATRHRSDLKIGVVVMHHPARADLIAPLVRACAPLRVQVVADPDPGGVPSPLRTAKRAWSAVAEGTTHHLVVQDDVVLSTRFAADLYAAVRARPRSAIALYTNSDSPENAHRVRLAATIGAPFAPLSAHEWTPTQGLVLPTPLARELAGYLERFPDETRDDDELVARFCRARSLTVLACVPHLVDHGRNQSLTGHDEIVRATVFAGAARVPRDHWTRRPDGLTGLEARTGATDPGVDLRNSRCLLRLPRSGVHEPVGHLFGWYWYDWCHAVGVDPDQILCTQESLVDRAVATEVWAAGYLLGHDAAGMAEGATHLGGDDRRWLDTALRHWLDQGLTQVDRAGWDRATRDHHARRAVARGWSDRMGSARRGAHV